MDQETHDAAVRTVAKVLGEYGWHIIADDLEKALSPSAKPEAKLEALPTMARMWFWAAMVDEHLVSSTETTNDIVAFLRSIARGELQIVDERGKGAEAERLAPCPVCGGQPFWFDEGAYKCTCGHIIQSNSPRGVSEPQARAAWNAAFKERAERFPGER